MARAIEHRAQAHSIQETRDWETRDWRKGMSDHVASALVVYTGLQIFVTVSAMKKGLDNIAPYLALVLLVAAVIPGCRKFERRWTRLSDDAAHDPGLASAYRKDLALLWGVAIGLPFALTFLFRLLFTV